MTKVELRVACQNRGQETDLRNQEFEIEVVLAQRKLVRQRPSLLGVRIRGHRHLDLRDGVDPLAAQPGLRPDHGLLAPAEPIPPCLAKEPQRRAVKAPGPVGPRGGDPLVGTASGRCNGNLVLYRRRLTTAYSISERGWGSTRAATDLSRHRPDVMTNGRCGSGPTPSPAGVVDLPVNQSGRLICTG